ncbi:MAG: hypothetical protein AAGL96_01745 [Pseudomonadota bacterium]
MPLFDKVLSPLHRLRPVGRGDAAENAPDAVAPLETVIGTAPRPAPRPLPLERALVIPCPDPTAEDRARDLIQNAALRLARQEDWTTLAAQLRTYDSTREKTGGGMPVADLMAFGARADVVAAAEHALISGRPDLDAPLLEGIEALEIVLAEADNDPMIAAVVASAHVDIGWAWRGTGWAIEVPRHNREAFAAHFERAAEIVEGLDPVALSSPLIASVKCAVSGGLEADVETIVADYERWITLDVRNPRAMRSMGKHLLPRFSGSYARLETEARRIAALTQGAWGAGAYCWTMMDAIAMDTEACARVDLDLFVEGLGDILDHLRDQHVVNMLAAYCANTMGDAPMGHDEADYARARIADAAGWIVRDHLRELHSITWAQASRGLDQTVGVRCRDRFAASGYADALRYLGDVFRRELAAGQRVIFTENGAQMRAG